MIRNIALIVFLICINAYAGLPPTQSKANGESSFFTTFKSTFSDFTATRSGTSATFALKNSGVTAGKYTYATVVVDAQGRITSASSGAAGTGSLSAIFKLTGPIVPWIDIDSTHYQTATQTLTTVNISEFNSGTSGSTVIQVNQYRSGSLQNFCTASLSSSSGNPSGTAATLGSCNSGSNLSLLAGDILTVDVNSVAGGTPTDLTVEW